jgi:hypothetical protein
MQEPRETLHRLIDRLPDAALGTAQQLLESLSGESVGPEFAESIRRGIAEADAGQTIVCGSFEEMVEKLLGAE